MSERFERNLHYILIAIAMVIIVVLATTGRPGTNDDAPFQEPTSVVK